MKECFEALTAMHSNKSPGNDGLSKEFYLAFFQTLGSDLLQCLNYSFQEGEMSSSQKQAVVTLIEIRTKGTLNTGDQFPYLMWMLRLFLKY